MEEVDAICVHVGGEEVEKQKEEAQGVARGKHAFYNVDSLGMMSPLGVELDCLERDSLPRVVPWQPWRHRLGRTEHDRKIASEGNNLGLRRKEHHLCRNRTASISR
mgnify:CR=1 FL=1